MSSFVETNYVHDTDYGDEAVAPMRGLINGLVLSAPFWLAAFVVVKYWA